MFATTRRMQFAYKTIGSISARGRHLAGVMRARSRIESSISKEGVIRTIFLHLTDPYKFVKVLDQIYFCYLIEISHVFN